MNSSLRWLHGCSSLTPNSWPKVAAAGELLGPSIALPNLELPGAAGAPGQGALLRSDSAAVQASSQSFSAAAPALGFPGANAVGVLRLLDFTEEAALAVLVRELDFSEEPALVASRPKGEVL